MRFKNDIFELIQSEYPELQKLDVRVGESEVKFNRRSWLTPYLIYKNTLDQNRRFITFYHPAESQHYKILPFYIGLAVYKKTIADAEPELLSEELDHNDASIYINGSAYSFLSFNYERNSVMLKPSTSNVKEFDFDEFERLAVGHSEGIRQLIEKLKKQIELYKIKSDDSIIGLLNNRRRKRAFNLDTGVIIFTNKSKFQGILDSISINSVQVKDAIHVVTAIWQNSSSSYKYKSISRFIEDAPLILLASYLDIAAVPIFQKRFPHLNTLIFDSADKYTGKLEHSLPKYYNELHSNTSSLRDIYLIERDNNIFNSYDIIKAYPESNFWLTTIQDFDSEQNERIGIHLVNEPEIIATRVEKIEAALKSLFDFHHRQHIWPIFHSFILIKQRISSFYEPDDLKEAIRTFCESLRVFLQEFHIPEHKDIIEAIEDEFSNLSKEVDNQKLSHLLGTQNLSRLLQEADEILVIANNSNNCDTQFIKDILELEHRLVISSGKDIEPPKNNRIVISFGYNYNYTRRCWYEDFGNKEIVLLNATESNKVRRNFRHVSRLVNKLTDVEQRALLLNIQASESGTYIDQSREQLPNDLWDKVFDKGSKPAKLTESLTAQEDDRDALLDIDSLERYFREQVRSNDTRGDYPKDDDHLFFAYDDGHIDIVASGKYFYRSLDANTVEINDIDNLRVRADELKEGDEIFWFDSSEYNELVDFIHKKVLRHPRLSKRYEHSERWRVLLSKIAERFGSNCTADLARLLERHAELRRQPLTIHYWLTGRTRVPQQFSTVLSGLNEIIKQSTLLNDLDVIEDIESVVGEAKSFKSYFTALPGSTPRIRDVG